MTTRSERIYDFTNQSKGNLPTHPRLMTREEVLFLVKMQCEEQMELLVTVLDKEENPNEILSRIVLEKAQPPPNYSREGKSTERLIEEQVDALVDIDYYNGNAAAKVGFNMDQVFDVVHEANMAKRFPDGKFHKNEEGKIIKPPGWKEGDVASLVQRWISRGTWSS